MKHVFIASFICIFAFQQLIEGFLWMALTDGKEELAYILSVVFLSFSHFLWLFLPQIAIALIEHNAKKKLIAKSFALAGFIFGCSIYFPLLINDGWLNVKILKHSIVYDVMYIYETVMSEGAIGLIYGSLLIIPMLLSSNINIKVMGIVVCLSGIFSYTVYFHSFVSIWCFFAAIISLYIVYIINKVSEGKIKSSF